MAKPLLNLEPTIRVIIALFAAIIGFGFKNILDDKDNYIFEVNKWIIFTTTLSIALRFLTGSANHLWLEYGKEYENAKMNSTTFDKSSIKIIFDLGVLITLGCFIAAMCYAASATSYFIDAVFFLGIACAWWFIDSFLRSDARIWPLRRFSLGKWGWWFICNTLHLLLFVFAILQVCGCWPKFEQGTLWIILLVGSLGLLILDMISQIKNLRLA